MGGRGLIPWPVVAGGGGVWHSFLEIYNEEIRDLLGNDPKLKCELKEDPSRGVFVKDLTDVVVQDEATMNRIMDKGVQNRTTGATLMNQVGRGG